MIMDKSCARSPMVSVIMPAYNAGRYIAKSIQSVQNQTVSDWELIVLDDCSADTTVQVVTQLAQKDPRIRLYQNQENLGVARSRNRGLDLCCGEYVAFLDSDDSWYPEKLEIQLNCFRQTGADLVYSSYAIVDASGNNRCAEYAVPSNVDFDGLLKENVIGCSTVMLSGSTAGKFRFSEQVFHEDYVLWLEMLRSGRKAEGVQQVLADYFFHADSKAGNKGKAAWERWQIYRRYFGFSLPKSIWYFGHYALAGLRKYTKV